MASEQISSLIGLPRGFLTGMLFMSATLMIARISFSDYALVGKRKYFIDKNIAYDRIILYSLIFLYSLYIGFFFNKTLVGWISNLEYINFIINTSFLHSPEYTLFLWFISTLPLCVYAAYFISRMFVRWALFILYKVFFRVEEYIRERFLRTADAARQLNIYVAAVLFIFSLIIENWVEFLNCIPIFSKDNTIKNYCIYF